MKAYTMNPLYSKNVAVTTCHVPLFSMSVDSWPYSLLQPQAKHLICNNNVMYIYMHTSVNIIIARTAQWWVYNVMYYASHY